MAQSNERDQTSRWVVTCASRILWERFEVGAAIYDDRTGQTHFLTPFAAKALELLAQAPLTRSDLSETVSRALGVNPGSDTLDMAEQSVALFHRLGLVEPTES